MAKNQSLGLLASLAFCIIGGPVSDACVPPAYPITFKYLLLAEGDSITAGQTADDGRGSYVQRACIVRLKQIKTVVTAVSRATLGSPTDPSGYNSLYGRMASDNALLKSDTIHDLSILSILVGRNDLVGYWGGPAAYAKNLGLYIRTMRRAGWDRVMVGTELPTAWSLFDKPRRELNMILRSPRWRKDNGVDAIADYAGSSEMGGDSAAWNKTFFSDGIHPNNHGYTVLAPIFSATVGEILAKAAGQAAKP